MAWFRQFFYKAELHSWFFNFHDKGPLTISIWFFHWWTMFTCCSSALPCLAKEWWDFWIINSLAYEAYAKEVQFFRTFNIAWILCWNTYSRIIYLSHFPYSLFIFIRSDGGMSAILSSAEKKMWIIFAKQNLKNTLCKTFTLLTNLNKLLLDHLPLPKWTFRLPLRNLTTGLTQNNEKSLKFSRMIPPWDRSSHRSSLTKTTQMTTPI